MKELVSMAFGILLGAVLAILYSDTSVVRYKGAEAACVSLGSHVKSFDMSTATCENTAEIEYVVYAKRLVKEEQK